jgi:hypothetical protein
VEGLKEIALLDETDQNIKTMNALIGVFGLSRIE